MRKIYRRGHDSLAVFTRPGYVGPCLQLFRCVCTSLHLYIRVCSFLIHTGVRTFACSSLSGLSISYLTAKFESICMFFFFSMQGELLFFIILFKYFFVSCLFIEIPSKVWSNRGNEEVLLKRGKIVKAKLLCNNSSLFYFFFF